MSRTLGGYEPKPHGKILMGGEPLVFHCNFYNYFLQKTLLLDETLGMESVIHDAALACGYATLNASARSMKLDSPDARRALAQDTFAQLGFGQMDLSNVKADGGEVVVPISHYGTALRIAAGAPFARAQSYFDAGYAAAATAFVHGRPIESLAGEIVACQSLGAEHGVVRVAERNDANILLAPGQGAHRDVDVGAPNANTNVDEAAILGALATLDFSGNEEGLVPRFGVMLTHHFANFYNRISFEFVRRMESGGLLEAGEDLLGEAGLRCAFHTFGGIMTSPEWDAVVRPQCQNTEDWVHGMAAVVNALGWGVWRVMDLKPDHVRVRIYDDYESSGYLGLYGEADRPISYLAAGAVAGMMNLVYVGDIQSKPTLDFDAYASMFESASRFTARHVKSMAMGADYTEIVAER